MNQNRDMDIELRRHRNPFLKAGFFVKRIEFA